MSIAIPSLEATCHSSEWLVEPHYIKEQYDQLLHDMDEISPY